MTESVEKLEDEMGIIAIDDIVSSQLATDSRKRRNEVGLLNIYSKILL